MLSIPKSVAKEWKAKNASTDVKADYLVDKFSAKVIARSFIELYEDKKKSGKSGVISISQSQFDSHFKIKTPKAKAKAKESK